MARDPPRTGTMAKEVASHHGTDFSQWTVRELDRMSKATSACERGDEADIR